MIIAKRSEANRSPANILRRSKLIRFNHPEKNLRILLTFTVTYGQIDLLPNMAIQYEPKKLVKSKFIRESFRGRAAQLFAARDGGKS